MNEVTFGHYDPEDCTQQKIMHGTNCTLTCNPGFELKGPPVKTCGGKKTGIWSNRNKHPKCIGNVLPILAKFIVDFLFYFTDVTPPVLTCPENFTVPMSDTENYAIVKIFPPPLNVTGLSMY